MKWVLYSVLQKSVFIFISDAKRHGPVRLNYLVHANSRSQRKLKFKPVSPIFSSKLVLCWISPLVLITLTGQPPPTAFQPRLPASSCRAVEHLHTPNSPGDLDVWVLSQLVAGLLWSQQASGREMATLESLWFSNKRGHFRKCPFRLLFCRRKSGLNFSLVPPQVKTFPRDVPVEPIPERAAREWALSHAHAKLRHSEAREVAGSAEPMQGESPYVRWMSEGWWRMNVAPSLLANREGLGIGQ